MISGANTVEQDVTDVKDNESWVWHKINAVPLMRYMGKGTDGMLRKQVEMKAENAGIAIPTLIRWLVSPSTSQERTKNVEIAVLLVAFVVNRSMMAQSISEKHI
jgi:hypothetical protein